MAEADLLIRSDYARARAEELARATGLSATQVVEAALAAWVPDTPPPEPELPPGLIREGRFLVLTGGPPLTAEDVHGAIDEARDERMRNIIECC